MFHEDKASILAGRACTHAAFAGCGDLRRAGEQAPAWNATSPWRASSSRRSSGVAAVWEAIRTSSWSEACSERVGDSDGVRDDGFARAERPFGCARRHGRSGRGDGFETCAPGSIHVLLRGDGSTANALPGHPTASGRDGTIAAELEQPSVDLFEPLCALPWCSWKTSGAFFEGATCLPCPQDQGMRSASPGDERWMSCGGNGGRLYSESGRGWPKPAPGRTGGSGRTRGGNRQGVGGPRIRERPSPPGP